MTPKEDDNLKKLIDLGAEIAGSSATTLAGIIVAGPVGGVVAAASSPIVIATFKKIGNEAINRLFPHRELMRAGAAISIALEEIQSKLKRGEKPRTDGFFDERPNDRGAGQEILEGILLTAQRDYQEKKIKFYAKLYANLGFTPNINRSHANYLITLLDRLSYRQLCMVAQAQNDRSLTFTKNSPKTDFVNELNDLVAQGILIRQTPSDVNHEFHLSSEYGKRICILFGLDSIDENERQETLQDDLASPQ